MKSARSLKGAYGALNGVYWMLCCLVYSFSSNFLLGRGYTNSQLGVIVAAGYILGLLFQPLAAALADRAARAPVAVITASAAAVAGAALALLFLPGKGPAVTAVYGLFLTLVIMLQPLVNAFAYYIERLGTAVPFGICRAVGSLAYGLLAAVLGGLLRWTGENVVPASGLITAVFFAVKNLLVLWAGSLGALYGGMSPQLIAYALFIPASVRYAGEVSGPRDANRAQAYVTAMSTAGSVCASGFGGVLIDRVGLRAAIAVCAACACAGALVMVLGVRRSGTGRTYGAV